MPKDDSKKIEQISADDPASQETQGTPEKSIESPEDLINTSDEERKAAKQDSKTLSRQLSSVDKKTEKAAEEEELPPGVLRNLNEYFQEYSDHVATIETNYVSSIRNLIKTTANRENAIRHSNEILQTLLDDLKRSPTIKKFKENSPTHYNGLLSAIQDIRIDSGTQGEKYEIDAPSMDGPFTLVPVHLESGKYEPIGIEYSVDPETGVVVRGFRDKRTKDHKFYPLSGNRDLYHKLYVKDADKLREEMLVKYGSTSDSVEKRAFIDKSEAYDKEMSAKAERWKISEDMNRRVEKLRDGISHLRSVLGEHGESFAKCVAMMQEKHMHHADLPADDQKSYFVVCNALSNLQKRLHEPDILKAMEEKMKQENQDYADWQSATEKGEKTDSIPFREMNFSRQPSGATYYQHDSRHALLGRVIAQEFETLKTESGAEFSLVFRQGVTGERYVYQSIDYFFDINDHFQLVMNNQQIDHNLRRAAGNPFSNGEMMEDLTAKFKREHEEKVATRREEAQKEGSDFQEAIAAANKQEEECALLKDPNAEVRNPAAERYRLASFVHRADTVLRTAGGSLGYPIEDFQGLFDKRNTAAEILSKTGDSVDNPKMVEYFASFQRAEPSKFFTAGQGEIV